jgi:hypothetical protein
VRTPSRDRSARSVGRLFWALFAIVYLLVYPYQQALNNPNENSRVYLTMALVDEGTFRLDHSVRLYGWTNDLARVPHVPTATEHDRARFHYASVKGPLVSYLGVPVYAAERVIVNLLGQPPPTLDSPPEARKAFLRTTTLTLQLFVVHLPCLLFLWLFERFLRGVTGDPRLRFAAVTALGLGTNYLAYAFLFASHALLAVAAFGAFALVVSHDRASQPPSWTTRRAFLVGLAIGAVTLLEYQALLVSVVLFAQAVRSVLARESRSRRPLRPLVALVSGIAPSVVALLLFQAKSFGHPLTPGHRMMDSAAFQAVNSQGFFTIGTPSWEALSGLLTDGGAGLFGASPVLLLALLSLPVVCGRAASPRLAPLAPATRFAWTVFFALVVPVSASSIWRGGWTIGPRYLGALPPFLLFLAVVGLEDGVARWRAAMDVRGIGWPIRPALVTAFASLSLVSFLSLGVVAFVTTTLPEAVQRPFSQVAWPFLREGLVPHHALELIGVHGRWPVYAAVLIAGVLLVGLLALTLWSARHDRRALVAAAVSLIVTLSLGVPYVVHVPGDAATDAAVRAEVRTIFARGWEPRR